MTSFYNMSQAAFEAAAERHFDRMLAEYEGTEDAWEHDDPDWAEVANIIEDWDEEDIADLVRDYLDDGDMDKLFAAYEAGLLDDYIHPEDLARMKDPDDAANVLDALFDERWEDTDFMLHLWADNSVCKPICEKIKDKVDHDWDDNKIRQEYNSRHEVDWEPDYDREWEERFYGKGEEE